MGGVVASGPLTLFFAESSGTLKRLSKSLSTARCVESITLRSAGLTGYGRGGEDGFFELRWAVFVQTEAFCALPQFEKARR